MKPPLLYALYTSNLYGTERMTLATAWALRDEFEPVILTAPGPVVDEAEKMGFTVVVVDTTNVVSLARALRPYLARYERLAFFGTRPVHSLVFSALNAWYRRRAAHVFVVHGGGWANKRRLNFLPVTLVAISYFVRERLVASGVRGAQIRVIENFLTDARVAAAVRRAPFAERGVRRVAVIGRLAPEKRVDLLLTCLETHPELAGIAFHVYGSGSELDALLARARAADLNVVFEGYRADVGAELARADLFLHLASEEPFGLVVLEAMAAGVPVLVPDRGGAAGIVHEGVSGLHFAADDPADLAACLTRLSRADAPFLNALAAGGCAALENRFSERARIADYRSLLRAAPCGPQGGPAKVALERPARAGSRGGRA